MEPQAGRTRLLSISSTILFVVFCVLWGLGPRIEPRAPGEFSVTGLITQLSGIFAWSLMCTTYQLRGKSSPERP